VEKCGRAGQATHYNMERMRIAFWIPTDTDPHSKYVVLTAFLLQK